MDRLPTRVNRADPDYQNRRTHNLELIETLRQRLDIVNQGGGGKYVERHRSRGKLLAAAGFGGNLIMVGRFAAQLDKREAEISKSLL